MYRTDIAEAQLSEREGLWADALRSLRTAVSLADVPGAHQVALLDMLVFQRLRTPSYQEELAQSRKKMASAITSIDGGEAMIKKWAMSPVSDTLEALEFAQTLVGLVLDLPLALLITTPQQQFVCGDNPCVMTNPLIQTRWPKAGFGMASKGLCLLLPVSPTECLLAYDYAAYKLAGKRRETFRVRCSPDDVLQINTAVAGQSNLQLYFRDMAEQPLHSVEYSTREARSAARSVVRVMKCDENEQQIFHTESVFPSGPLATRLLQVRRNAYCVFNVGEFYESVRNPQLVIAHSDYQSLVASGGYEWTDFMDYYKDHYEGLARLQSRWDYRRSSQSSTYRVVSEH
jgi:hypothetical protein